MKKVLSLILSLIVVVGSITSLPVGVSAGLYVDGGICGLYGDNVNWSLDSDGVLCIYGKGEMQNYTNDSTAPWIEYKTSIKKIFVDVGVTTIGSFAFAGLQRVTSAEISNDVVAIGNNAFASCWEMTEIILSNKLQFIGDYCFYYCNDLVSVYLPDTVTKIGRYAFSSCKNLKNLKLSANLAVLPELAFYGCKSLTSVAVPEGVTEIEGYCFKACSSLKSISLPSTLKEIDGCVFYDCTNLSSLKLPSGITYIGWQLCYGCTSLTKVEIPNSVKSIKSSAFENCINLSSVFLPDSIKTIASSAFYGCVNLKNIFVPDSATSLGDYFFGYYKDVYQANSVIPKIKMYCCTGSKAESYAINNNIDYSLVDISVETSDCKYTGEPIMPDVNITIDGVELIQNVDYTIEFYNNIDVGIATAAISYINASSEKVVFLKDFRIGKLVSECSIVLDSYEGQFHNVAPVATVTDGEKILILNQDYEVHYTMSGETRNNSCVLWDIGECTVKIVGINGYVGEETIVVPVGKFDMANAYLMTEWVHHGNYSTSETFSLQDFEYNGKPRKQKNFRVCEDVSDTIDPSNYDISYENNILPGIATLVITGKGDYYTGVYKAYFEIHPTAPSKPNLKEISNTEYGVKITWGKVSLTDSYKVYRKTSKSGWKYIGSTTKTYYTDKTAKSGTKYYYAVKARNEAGNSSLSSSLSKLYLADTTLKTPSSTKSGIKLKWSKVTGAEGYMVYRKTGSGSYSKIATVKGNSKVTYTDKSAKKGKTYTYKIKAYKSKTYSAYSNTRTIKDKY